MQNMQNIIYGKIFNSNFLLQWKSRFVLVFVESWNYPVSMKNILCSGCEEVASCSGSHWEELGVVYGSAHIMTNRVLTVCMMMNACEEFALRQSVYRGERLKNCSASCTEPERFWGNIFFVAKFHSWYPLGSYNRHGQRRLPGFSLSTFLESIKIRG